MIDIHGFNYMMNNEAMNAMQSSNTPLPPISMDDRCIQENYMMNVVDGKPKPLGKNYVPGKWDVICARGKVAFGHPGNKFFRNLIAKMHSSYAKANTKLQRSVVVTEVVDTIRSMGSGFIKQEPNGQWIEVGDRLAREKCGQMLRDSLSSIYRSSAKAKKRRRIENSTKISANMEQVIFSNLEVSCIMSQLSTTVKSESMSDEEALALFNQANCAVLGAFKKDTTLVKRFRDATAVTESSDDDTASLPDDEVTPMLE